MLAISKIAGFRLLLFTCFGIIIPVLLIGGFTAIRFSNISSDATRNFMSMLYLVITVLSFFFIPNIKRPLQFFFGSQLIIWLWWISITPSNDREWPVEISKMPKAEFLNDDKVKISNLRNFHYRSNNDFDVRFDDREYELSKITGTDLFLSYWDGNQGIAHTFLSFRFEDQAPICISVEVRREKNEIYNTAKGLFKQFELFYVMGDEKDILQVRTNHRGEETFLYPTQLNKAHSRQLLTSILKGANDLIESPKFYHTLGQNCTTTLVDHFNELEDIRVPTHRKILLNGISDHFAYQQGLLNNELPFTSLKSACYISDIAQGLKDHANFSKEIRKAVDTKIKAELKLAKI